MNREEMLERLKEGEDPLELSIEKWQNIVDGKGEDHQDRNCALCEVAPQDRDHCRGCPVHKRTGEGDCHKTPYIDYINAKSDEEERVHAIREVVFLKSLRKK